MQSVSCDPHSFRLACGRFPTGVTVATLRGKDGLPCGITLNSFVSLSLCPPLIMVCIDGRSQILKHLTTAHNIAVNVLSDEQCELSRQFAGPWEARFHNIMWRAGTSGTPVLCGAATVLECSVVEIKQVGDHHMIISLVLHVDITDRRPLTFLNGSYWRLDAVQALG